MAEFQSKFTGQEVDNAIDKLRNWIGVDGTYPTVTISGVTYAVIWKSIPVSGTPCYGIGLHPTTGRIYEIYYNGSSYTATALDTDTKNTAGSTNSTSRLFLVGAGSQGVNPQTFSNSQVYTTDGTLYLTKTTDLSGTANNHPALIVGGTDTAAHLEVDANEIHAKATGTTVAPLYLNHDGGNTYLSGENTYSDGNYLYSNNTKVSVEGHTHDNRYYTETEIDTKLNGKSDTGHIHDDRYYTETEIDTKLSGKSDIDHTHSDYLPLSGGDLSGSVVPQTNNSYNLGTNSNRWANIYATTFYENGTALSSKYQAKGDYLQLTGGSVTGDLALYAASGNSPRLTFQRGNLKDALNDWSLYDDNSGYLCIQQRGSESTSWETRATFSQSGVNFAGTISEDGKSLANKYLGKTAKAADADKLDGNDSTYYLNLDNINDGSTRKLANYVPKSLTSAKGDMIYASDANTPARLGIGSNGQFLSIANGIPKWVNNPNTDTKVTSVDNHYSPTANSGAELTAALSGTAGAYAKDTEYTVLTGVKAQRDAKGHVTGITYTAQKIKDTNTDTNTSHSHSAGVGLVGSGSAGTGGGTYDYKAKLRSETALTVDSAAATTTSGRVYPVAVDKSGYLSVNVPWTDTNTDTDTHYTNYLQINGNGTAAIKFEQNANKTLNLKPGTNVSISATSGEITISATDTNTDTKVTAVGNHYTPANGANLTVSSSGTATRGSTKVLTNVAIDAAGHITGGTWYTLPDSDNTDTKNTAGSTSSASKLFLVGATSQAANPQTYSYSTVYETSGTLNATKFTVDAEHTGGTIQYNAANGCMEIIC